MSTITKEFTKEQLIEQAKKNIEVLRGAVEKIPGASDAAVIHLKLAEITLASLEAGPVAFVMADDLKDSSIISTPAYRDLGEAMERTVGDIVGLYTAPPAPIVPDCFRNAVAALESLYRNGQKQNWNERYTTDMAYASGVLKACRAAMLQGVENAETPANMQTAPALDSSPKIAESHTGINQGKSEPVTTANKLRDAVEIIRSSGIAIDGEKILAERDALNSPVIPDGWALVPVEPTAEMISSGITAHFERSQIQIHDRPAPGPMECAYVAMLAAAPNFRENAETSTKCWCRTCRPVTMTDMRFVVCPDCGNKRCPHANDHRNACTGSNEPGQEGSAYPAAPQQEVK